MHEYKVVPAPSRAPKVKGLKTTVARFAHALTEAINAETAGGWQFLRTETLPCEERGTLGKTRLTTQVVMIFGRALDQARPDAGAALAAMGGQPAAAYADEAPYAPPQTAAYAPEPAWEPPPAPPAPLPGTRREPLFRAGPLLRAETGPRAEPLLRPRPPMGDDA